MPDLPASVYVPAFTALGLSIVGLVSAIKIVVAWLRADADKRDAERSVQRKEDLVNMGAMMTELERNRSEMASMRLDITLHNAKMAACLDEVRVLVAALKEAQAVAKAAASHA